METREGALLRWYVIQSKPQKEKWLCSQFSALQIEAYYPCVHVESKNSHLQRPKPYFPGYLFVNVDLEITGISMLQWIPGSMGLVVFGGEPACVPDTLLQKIRHRVDELNRVKDEKWSRLKPGDQVNIRSGPFAGYDAIFCARLRDTERAQVLLKVLQNQAMRIDLSVDQLTITNRNTALLLKQ